MTIATFAVKAPIYMTKLIEDFDFSVMDAAAIMGNLGYESGGLTNLQEDNPTVPGSAGGWGWAQWTGSRRRTFEEYAKRNGLDPSSDKANYSMLFNELKGTERGAVSKTKNAGSLSEKVKAFENSYERAGIKNYASRDKWAVRALNAYNGAVEPPAPEPMPIALANVSRDDMIEELLKRPLVKSVLVEYGN
jgi:hypothetical protein